MSRRLAGMLAATISVGCASSASALPTDYRFDPVVATVERGVDVTLKVQIRERWQNRLIPNVDIQAPQVDRSPDGLPQARLPAFFAPGLDYGTYQFRAALPTDGAWALTFVAKVPGEPQPIVASVVFKVVGPGRTGPSGAASTSQPSAPAPRRTN